VTHDVDEAIALADRVLVLADGRIAHESRIELDLPATAITTNSSTSVTDSSRSWA
jgi:ABC-type nitrate/sulfonate/bicarbonate transport system ATPase subunit